MFTGDKLLTRKLWSKININHVLFLQLYCRWSIHYHSLILITCNHNCACVILLKARNMYVIISFNTCSHLVLRISLKYVSPLFDFISLRYKITRKQFMKENLACAQILINRFFRLYAYHCAYFRILCRRNKRKGVEDNINARHVRFSNIR